MTDKGSGTSSRRTRRDSYLQHICSLLAPLGHILRFSQQIVEEAGFIQLANELALETVLHMVDQEVHHRLRHAARERNQSEQMVENKAVRWAGDRAVPPDGGAPV